MSEFSRKASNRLRFVSRLMLSVDGSLALGATHWIEGYRLGFTVRTFLLSGARVKLRLVLPGSKQTVDTVVVIEEANSTDDWAEFQCVGVFHEMKPRDRSLLDRWVRSQDSGRAS